MKAHSRHDGESPEAPAPDPPIGRRRNHAPASQRTREDRPPPLRLAVLASGRGSNLQAILDAIIHRQLHAQVVGVFSDRPTARALQRVAPDLRWSARPGDFPSRAAHDAALAAAVAGSRPDWVVCAGYMRILDAAFIDRFHGRLLNIHPSLLPKYKGLNTHARALDAGDHEHGCSVHFVIPELDAGAVIAQAALTIDAGDTPQTLAARLRPLEHHTLLETLRLAAAGRLRQHDNRAFIDGHPLFTPWRLNCRTSRIHPPT